MKKLTAILLALVWILQAAALAYSFHLGYRGCLDVFIALHGPSGDSSQFYNFLTGVKFHQFQYLLAAITLITTTALLRFDAAYQFTSTIFPGLFYSVINAVKSAFGSEFRYLLIIPVLTSMYFAITMPISFDEALTYTWFTSKGLLSSVAYYPAPNNHILHSVITCITSHIPFVNPVLRVRVSSLAAGFITLIFSHALVKKHFNSNTALAVVAVSSMLFMSLYYSYMSRGYALAGLFFITALYPALNIIKGEEGSTNFACFGISSVLGFYTMPSFLYAFVMLNIILLLCSPKAIAKVLLADVVTCGAVVLLYMPVIIVNGFDALVNNEYVAPLARTEIVQKLPGFTPYAIHEITGIAAVYFIPFLLLSLTLLLKYRKRTDIIFFLVFTAGPFILVLAHSVIRYSRTFSYYTFVLTLLIAFPWQYHLQKIRAAYLLPVLIILQLALLYNFSSQIYLYEHYTLTGSRVIQAIAGNKTYFCDEPMFEIPLQFKLSTGGYSHYKFDRKHNALLSADTVNGYDYVIIRNTLDKTVKRVPQIKTEFYCVY